MSGAKLSKNHEPNMVTLIKNRKRCTKRISVIILVILFSGSVFNGSRMLAQEPGKTWVIVLDAGHGGKDPGAIGSIIMEKDINLAIALKTGEYLEQNVKNVKILYTRRNDSFPGLKERAEFANRNKADLFISIHANWSGAKSVRGAETFVMGLSKDEQNLQVAMKENEVILLEEDFSSKYQGFDPKSPESYIIFSLMQNVFREQSLDLASKVQSQFKNRTGRIDRGVKQNGFWVLYMTSMPSILIETGFITNPEEEKYLKSKTGQEYIASAIYRALRDYINEVDKKSYISTAADHLSEPETGSAGPSKPEQDSVPSGNNLFFMVQIASSTERKTLNPENFSGLDVVTELRSGNIFKYAAGSFITYSEAAEYRKKIESTYPGAFVIAVRDKQILPLQEALESKD